MCSVAYTINVWNCIEKEETVPWNKGRTKKRLEKEKAMNIMEINNCNFLAEFMKEKHEINLRKSYSYLIFYVSFE